MPDQEQIDDVLNQCLEAEDEGTSKFPGMSYEQGVRAAIEWMTGQTRVTPLED